MLPLRLALIPVFLLATFSAAGAASTMGAGPLWATTTDDLNCSLFNAGTAAVTIGSIRILKADGTVVSGTAGDCKGSLGVAKTCIVDWAVTAVDFYSCRAVLPGTDTTPLRGLFFRRTQVNVTNTLEVK